MCLSLAQARLGFARALWGRLRQNGKLEAMARQLQYLESFRAEYSAASPSVGSVAIEAGDRKKSAQTAGEDQQQQQVRPYSRGQPHSL